MTNKNKKYTFKENVKKLNSYVEGYTYVKFNKLNSEKQFENLNVFLIESDKSLDQSDRNEIIDIFKNEYLKEKKLEKQEKIKNEIDIFIDKNKSLIGNKISTGLRDEKIINIRKLNEDELEIVTNEERFFLPKDQFDKFLKGDLVGYKEECQYNLIVIPKKEKMEYKDLVGRKLITEHGRIFKILSSDFDNKLNVLDLKIEYEDQKEIELTLDNADAVALVTCEKFKLDESNGFIELIKEEDIEDVFSSPEKFVIEFKDYLVGKKIKWNFYNKEKGFDYSTPTQEIVDLDIFNGKATIELKERKGEIISIPNKDLKSFIDGEDLNFLSHPFHLIIQEEEKNKYDFSDYSKIFILKYNEISEEYFLVKEEKYSKNQIQLFLKPEKLDEKEIDLIFSNDEISKINNGEIYEYKKGWTIERKLKPILEEKLNKSEYKYYIVDSISNKICLGYEYKEDASKALKIEIKNGKNYKLLSQRELIGMGIDPYDNSNWCIPKIDNAFLQPIIGTSIKAEDLIKDKEYGYLISLLVNKIHSDGERLKKYAMFAHKIDYDIFIQIKTDLLKSIEQLEVLVDLNKNK